MQRRAFLTATALSATRVLGANDRVRVALIGCGGRGRHVANLMRRAPGAEFVAACDVYQTNAEAAREWAGGGAKAYGDFRRVMDQQDIDAVLIATPDHWHCLPMIAACEAGKDVYVEKPMAHNIHEQQAMVAAARKHNRVVQVGTQHRSAPHFPEVAEMIRSGEIGEVRFIRVWNYVNLSARGPAQAIPDSPAPAGLDWDFYCGPAPLVPFNKARFLATYRYFFDYSGGYVTDFGIHRLDTVHQIMGLDAKGENAPRKISAAGARYSWKGPGDVPDTLQVTFEYPGFIVSYESSNLNGFGMGAITPGHKYYNQVFEHDQPNGICVYGSNGTIFAERIGYEVFPEPTSYADKRPRIKERRRNVTDATEAHAANFIECVRSRKQPNAPPEVGHRSSSVAHLANIAYKTGLKLEWDPAAERFTQGGEPATNLLARKARRPWNRVSA